MDPMYILYLRCEQIIYSHDTALFFHDLGRVMMKTSFGYEVPVYDMERTICDLIRNRSNIEIQTFQDVMKQYVRRKDKNLNTLN